MYVLGFSTYPPPPLFGRSPQRAVEVDPLCGVENFYSAQVELLDHVVFYSKAPTRQLHSDPNAGIGSGHTGKQINLFDVVIHVE